MTAVHHLPDMARLRAFEARFMAELDDERAADLLATDEGT